jgi:UDP-glucose 6-dehydrogenase
VPATQKKPLLIGFVGQGFVGKSYADDFERRGYATIRYALEKPYRANRNKIKGADIVFICVPTSMTPDGFDPSIVEEALALAGNGTIAVIKSTVLPGTTRRLQKKFPGLTILCLPEFLNVATAAHDSANPFSNIIGLPHEGTRHRKAARLVHATLPKAPFNCVCTSEEAEIIKYAHNISGYMQVLAYNLIYDVAEHHGADWRSIHAALEADPMISNWYIRPVHKKGRGAGGACFVKDFAAFAGHYAAAIGRPEGKGLLRAAEEMNVALLTQTNKDVDIVRMVYGGKKISNRKLSAPNRARRARGRP